MWKFTGEQADDASGASVEDNLYWVAPNNDFTVLNDLPRVALEGSTYQERHGNRVQFTVTLTNPTESIAFFTHPMVTQGTQGDEVLPTFWSDNYFSILPGETKTVTAYVDGFRLEGNDATVRVDGWNVTPVQLPTTQRE